MGEPAGTARHTIDDDAALVDDPYPLLAQIHVVRTGPPRDRFEDEHGMELSRSSRSLAWQRPMGVVHYVAIAIRMSNDDQHQDQRHNPHDETQHAIDLPPISKEQRIHYHNLLIAAPGALAGIN